MYFFATVTFAAELSATEKDIQKYVNKEKKSQIALLKKIVNISSPNNQVKGVERVGEVVRAELKKLGFKTRWARLPKKMNKAGTLIAERQGKSGQRLLLISHLDTVFLPTAQTKRFTIQKNIATGPGVVDNKGGVVTIIYALKALHSVSALKNATITIVLTGDEEESGKPTSISRKPLLDIAKKSDVALDFEPSVSLDTATIARRGVTDWSVESQGNESHAATIFKKDIGDGAIFELARVLNAMHDAIKNEKKYLSFNPGIIIGGTSITYDAKKAKGEAFGKQNVVAKTALAKGDFRYVDHDEKELIQIKITEIVKQHLPETKSELTFQDGIPAMSPTENNLKLLEKYSAVSIDLGQGAIKALDPTERGAGDISYAAQFVPSNLAGLGPLGLGAHSSVENIQLNSLPIQTERAAILIYRLISSN